MAQPTHQELATRMEDFDKKLNLVLAELTQMKHSIDKVESEVSQTKEIVEAWGAVKTAGKFVTWLSSVTAAVVAVYILAKTAMAHFVGK